MTTNDPDDGRRLYGVPYDFRRPTIERARSRLWNKDDPRLFTPRVFGVGWDVNLYWLTHPQEYVERHRTL